jgi:oxygen-independent coproporphyrinogen-3 oxidase
MRINFQTLRHTRIASGVRGVAYRALIGDDTWPPTFRAPADRSLRPEASGNVYVHIPFCETLCPHCPYNKVKADPRAISDYRDALLREIRAYSEGPAAPSKVASLYFGGGTPSLAPEIVEDVISEFRHLFLADAEIAMEVYPSHATEGFLRRARAGGVNRISLGIESLEPLLLKRLGRRYSPEAALEAIAQSKVGGFEMVDVNLILGIPGQEVDAFLAGARACIEAGADQLSAYPLFTFDHTPAGRSEHMEDYARVDDVRRLRMQRGVARLALDSGLRRTSVWSYTRVGLSPYTTVTRPDYIGFGAGAGSKSSGLALFNTFSVPEYVRSTPSSTALVYRLSRQQKKADWLYWQVYNARIERLGYEDLFGVPLEKDYGLLLRSLRAMGFLKRSGEDYRLTESGAIWVHRMQSLFSLNGIDAVWSACMEEPWPKEVALV